MLELSNSERLTLSLLEEELELYIAASEDGGYAPSITKDTKTFDRLVKLENRMEREFTSYFKDLAPRIIGGINWNGYRLLTAADEDPLITSAVSLIKNDSALLIRLSFGFFEEAGNIGADAASSLNNIAVTQTLRQVIQRQAIRYSNKFVSNIDDTTRNLLRSALRTSLDLGEDINGATERVYDIIDNPVRSRMIARTEPVNTYGRGIQLFGQNTGAKGKVIDAVIDNRTSPICIELNGKYGDDNDPHDLEKPYIWEAAGGGKKMEPGFHIFCRTGHYLKY